MKSKNTPKSIRALSDLVAILGLLAMTYYEPSMLGIAALVLGRYLRTKHKRE